MRNNKIKDTIKMRDLVLIVNTEKPLKTGWYRLLIEDEGENKEQVLVFEKPLHKDFDDEDKSLVHSRKIKGVFLMKLSTLMHDKNSKYIVYARVRGIDSVILQRKNYSILSIDLWSKNVDFTNDFVSLISIYKTREQNNSITQVANYIM